MFLSTTQMESCIQIFDGGDTMERMIKIIKALGSGICIMIIITLLLIKFYPPLVISAISKVQPQLIEKLYPDCLSNVDSISINDLKVFDDAIALKIENYDGGLIVKSVHFQEIDDVLYIYVYKGLFVEKEYNSLFEYKTDMTKISKIVLVGTKEETKELWHR